MAEAAGLILGGLSLASLFSSCIECFEYLRLSRTIREDYESLQLQLDNQRLRLTTWAKALSGLRNKEEFSGGPLHLRIRRIKDGTIRSQLRLQIKKTLKRIRDLLKNGEELEKKYGLVTETQADEAMVSVGKQYVSPYHDFFRNTQRQMARPSKSFSLRRRLFVVLSSKRPNLFSNLRWGIVDKQRFEELVNDIRNLISDLENFTKDLEVSEPQLDIMKRTMASVNVEWLMFIETASTNDRAVSDAASQRRTQLDGSNTTPYMGALGDGRSKRFSASIMHRVNASTASLRSLDALYESKVVERFKTIRSEDEAKVGQVHTGPKRLLEEFKRFRALPNYVSFALIDGDAYDLLGSFQGPPGSPYEDGIFTIRMLFPSSYPDMPPVCKMLTPVYHPNIDKEGRVALKILAISQDGKQGSLAWQKSKRTIETVMISLVQLFKTPNTEEPLVKDIANEIMRDIQRFENTARSCARKEGGDNTYNVVNPTHHDHGGLENHIQDRIFSLSTEIVRISQLRRVLHKKGYSLLGDTLDGLEYLCRNAEPPASYLREQDTQKGDIEGLLSQCVTNLIEMGREAPSPRGLTMLIPRRLSNALETLSQRWSGKLSDSVREIGEWIREWRSVYGDPFVLESGVDRQLTEIREED